MKDEILTYLPQGDWEEKIHWFDSLDSTNNEVKRRAVDQVHVSDDVLSYLLELIEATRRDPQILQGASPRATLAVASASRAAAFLRGRDYVLPEDVQCMWVDVVAHRLILAPAAEGSVTAAAIAERLLRAVEAPKIR